MRDRVPIKKENLPYRVNLILAAGVYTVEIHYNSRMDGYVLHLYRGDELLCGGEKLVYGRPLWRDCYEAEQYPVLRLVPYDESDQADEVTRETLGKTVFLTIEDQGDSVES